MQSLFMSLAVSYFPVQNVLLFFFLLCKGIAGQLALRSTQSTCAGLETLQSTTGGCKAGGRQAQHFLGGEEM